MWLLYLSYFVSLTTLERCGCLTPSESHTPEPLSQALLLGNSTRDIYRISLALETNTLERKEAGLPQLRHRDKESIFITAHAWAIPQAQLSNGNIAKHKPSRPAAGQHLRRRACLPAMITLWLGFSWGRGVLRLMKSWWKCCLM